MQERTAVHLSLRWGDVTLRTATIEGNRGFVLGRGGDWELPAEALGASRFELLSTAGDWPVLVIPPAATASVHGGSAAPFRLSPCHALRLGSHAHVALGALSIDVEVARAEARFLHRAPIVGDAALHHVLSLGFHVGLLALAARVVPAFAPGATDAEQEAESVAFLVHAQVAASGTPAGIPGDEHHGPRVGQGSSGWQDRSTAPAAGDEETTPDKAAEWGRDHVRRSGQWSVFAAHRGEEKREAMTHGLLGAIVLNDTAAPASSPWEDMGGETIARPRDLRGATMGGDFDLGGLSLSGPGEGSGERAGELRLGNAGMGGMGQWDSGGGLGVSGDYAGTRATRLAHSARGPRSFGDESDLGGRLGADAIQRVVRANFGRFRLCFERGLVMNPTLNGRVTTRFLIRPDGTVRHATQAAPADSDLPNAAVVSCVVSTFSGLTFPEPTGGAVAVEYPILFSPE